MEKNVLLIHETADDGTDDGTIHGADRPDGEGEGAVLFVDDVVDCAGGVGD